MPEDTRVRVVDNPSGRRYEAYLGDQLAGLAVYEPEQGRLVFTHTTAEPAFEGKGVGSRLAAGALDDARARGLSVGAVCPFVAGYIRRHPAYADLLTSR